jgi:hypothetical protein
MGGLFLSQPRPIPANAPTTMVEGKTYLVFEGDRA